MTITVTAFKWVPDFAQGSVKDIRVRWALEEAGLDYEERLIGPDDQTSESYRADQPFGQVPVYQEDGLTLFESGAIVLHIAGKSEALMPKAATRRARVTTTMFMALNTIEPCVGNLADIDIFNPDEAWAKQRRPDVLKMLKKRLSELATWLGNRDYLEDRFTAADILMATVLRDLRHTEIIAEFPALDAYVKRCEARPAFRKALADQMAAFVRNAPPEE